MAMSITSAVWQSGPNHKTYLLILMAIADAADQEGVAFPKISTIATLARCSRTTAFEGIKWLEQEGWLSREGNQSASGKTRRNTYRINLARLDLAKPKKSGVRNPDYRGPKSVPPRVRNPDPTCTVRNPDPLTQNSHKNSAGARDRTTRPLLTPEQMNRYLLEGRPGETRQQFVHRIAHE